MAQPKQTPRKNDVAAAKRTSAAAPKARQTKAQQTKAQQTKPVPAKRRSSASGLPRDEEIVAEATRFFADCGFAGQTRELAKRLGVSQPALYKHFANKSDLIERVYQAVFLSRWSPAWEQLLDDRSLTPAERLTRFYQDYARVVVEYNWIRITLQAALAGDDLTQRYVKMVGERIVPRICHVLREHNGKPRVADSNLTPSELQIVWDLQGCILYLAIKQFVYGLAPLQPLDVSVTNIVKVFLGGTGDVQGR